MSKLKYYDGTTWKVVNGEIIGDTLPIGGIIPYGSTTAPTNWLVCDGSAVSRTDYAELFAVIGISYGTGDGSTTFNLPDLRGRVAVGQKSTDTDFDTIGETGGSKTDNLSSAYAKVGRSSQNYGTISYKSFGGNSETHDRILEGGGGISGATYNAVDNSALGGSVSTLQPYQVVCYIIKAKQSAGVVANVSGTYSESETDTYSCDYINDAIKSIYSTTEQIIGDYLGKPLYRKVIQLTAEEYSDLSPGSGRRTLPVSTLAVDRLLTVVVSAKYNDGTKVCKKSYPSHSVSTGSSGNYDIGSPGIEDDNLNLWVGPNIVSGLTDKIDIILEYTKTTD